MNDTNTGDKNEFGKVSQPASLGEAVAVVDRLSDADKAELAAYLEYNRTKYDIELLLEIPIADLSPEQRAEILMQAPSHVYTSGPLPGETPLEFNLRTTAAMIVGGVGQTEPEPG